MRAIWTILKRALNGYIAHDALSRGAAIAFYVVRRSFSSWWRACIGVIATCPLSETQSCWQLISNRAMLLPYARGL